MLGRTQPNDSHRPTSHCVCLMRWICINSPDVSVKKQTPWDLILPALDSVSQGTKFDLVSIRFNNSRKMTLEKHNDILKLMSCGTMVSAMWTQFQLSEYQWFDTNLSICSSKWRAFRDMDADMTTDRNGKYLRAYELDYTHYNPPCACDTSAQIKESHLSSQSWIHGCYDCQRR